MENKEAKQQAEVTIELTEEQREQVKREAGKLVTELKVETVEERANPGVRSFYID
jgi:uncharacterized protein (UPF0218 family)